MFISFSELVVTIVLWGGVVAVPVLIAILGAVLKTTDHEKPWRASFVIVSLFWFAGLPLALYAFKGYQEWRVQEEMQSRRTAFLELCRSENKENISGTIQNVAWIRFETQGETPDGIDPRISYLARGKNVNEYGVLDKESTSNEAHVVIRMKFSKMKLPVGSEVQRIQSELVDSTSAAILARRVDFTSGTDSCGQGSWNAEILRLLRQVAAPIPKRTL